MILCSTKLHLFDENIVKKNYKTIFTNIYFCDVKAEFSADISLVFRVTWSLRSHSDLVLKKRVLSKLKTNLSSFA